jgi:hypothetical protein
MISNLEKLSSALRTVGNPENDDDAVRLAERIKSDPRIQDELRTTGQANVRDDAGRNFVVRRKAAGAFVPGR